MEALEQVNKEIAETKAHLEELLKRQAELHDELDIIDHLIGKYISIEYRDYILYLKVTTVDTCNSKIIVRGPSIRYSSIDSHYIINSYDLEFLSKGYKNLTEEMFLTVYKKALHEFEKMRIKK